MATAHVHEGRRHILHGLLQATYELWLAMVQGRYCKVQTVTSGVQRRCAAANLLGFTQYLRSLRLFPMLRKSTVYQHSPVFLATRLLGTKYEVRIADTVSIDRRGSAPLQTPEHVQCHVEFRLKPIVSRVLRGSNWPERMPPLDSAEVNGGELQLSLQKHIALADFRDSECEQDTAAAG